MTANPAPSSEPAANETRVGIRELRHDFRAWLDRARAGERIIVTDRGEPIADLIRYRPRRSRLQELRDQGLVVPARTKGGVRFSPAGAESTEASDELQRQREDRI
jgi:prevent-host-death family protein